MSKSRIIKVTCEICGEETAHESFLRSVNLDELPCDYCAMRRRLQDCMRKVNHGLSAVQIRKLYNEEAQRMVELSMTTVTPKIETTQLVRSFNGNTSKFVPAKTEFYSEEEQLKNSKKPYSGSTFVRHVPTKTDIPQSSTPEGYFNPFAMLSEQKPSGESIFDTLSKTKREIVPEKSFKQTITQLKPPTTEEEEQTELEIALAQSKIDHDNSNNNSLGSFPSFDRFNRH